jgi:ribonuclease VapC
MNKTVLDASAVLAFLQEEPGTEQVRAALAHSLCFIGAANLAEAAGKLFERLGDMTQVRELLAVPGLERLPVTDEDACLAGELVVHAKPLGLSLGDRLCLALGLRENAKVLTADQAWLRLKVGPRVEVIRGIQP